MFFWPLDPDIVFWVVSGALALRYHKSLEGRLVLVLHSLVIFIHGCLTSDFNAYLFIYAFNA